MLEFRAVIVPKAKVIATVFNPVNPTNPPMLDNLRAQAGAHGNVVAARHVAAAGGPREASSWGWVADVRQRAPVIVSFRQVRGDVPGADITEAPAITSLTSASNLSGPTSLLTRARVQQ